MALTRRPSPTPLVAVLYGCLHVQLYKLKRSTASDRNKKILQSGYSKLERDPKEMDKSPLRLSYYVSAMTLRIARVSKLCLDCAKPPEKLSEPGGEGFLLFPDG